MNPEDENASKSGSEGEEDQDATVCPMGNIDGDMNELKELLKNMLDIKKEMAVIQEIKTIVSKNTADIAQMQQPRINIANVAQSQHHLVQMEQSENTTGQVYKKLHDLPEYSGSAEDWPLFIANYTDTTNAFQYDNRQNLIRLHKCLTGEAKEAVAPMMIYPEDVPSIIEELQFRFGRPELLIHTQLSKIKEFPKIAYNKPEQIISLSTKVRGVVAYLKLPRWYSQNLKKNSELQLHIMVDASQVAFAAAAYLRITNGQESDIVFIMGKTRLAPKKLLSIPRLELQAAVLGVRLATLIHEHHHLTLTQTTFWSDSMTVLQWINSTSRRFKPFVGHRVAEIISTTLPDQWRWVPTEQNTADAATRPENMPKIDHHSKWLSGPTFLKKAPDEWPKTVMSTKTERLEEEICSHPFLKCQVSVQFIDFTNFSSFSKLKGTMAWVLRAKNSWLKGIINKQTGLTSDTLTVDELHEAEKWICRMVQEETYAEEIAALSKSDGSDLCLRKQWRIAQTLKDRIWKRWINEYLPQLVRRPKWHNTTEPIKIGDLVIIIDASTNRDQWKRGRVVNVHTAKDKQIRSAEIQTADSTLRRPVSKLIVLKLDVDGES
ncbi:hypothetical protein ACLKA6_000406 [Drosophila palustris]